jgi:hypothetical protein
LIVPQERQSCEAAPNGQEESAPLRKKPIERKIPLTYIIRLLIRYFRPCFPVVSEGGPPKTILTTPRLIYAANAMDSLFGLYPKSSKTRQYCTDFYAKARSSVMTKDRQLAD